MHVCSFRVESSTIYKFAPEVCKAIIEVRMLSYCFLHCGPVAMGATCSTTRFQRVVLAATFSQSFWRLSNNWGCFLMKSPFLLIPSSVQRYSWIYFFETRTCFFCCTVASSTLNGSLWVWRGACCVSAVTSLVYACECVAIRVLKSCKCLPGIRVMTLECLE